MRFTAVLICTPLLFNLPSSQAVPVDEIGIYRAVLADSACSGLGRSAGRHVLMIHRTTQSLRGQWWIPSGAEQAKTEIPNWFPQAGPDVVIEYLRSNEHEKELAPSIFTALGVTTFDESVLQVLEETGNFWEAFYKRYPTATGLIRLGAVAVQPATSQVLAYCGRQSAPLGGEGHLFLVSRSASGWAVTARRLLWES
jgi:hypothetical protein